MIQKLLLGLGALAWGGVTFLAGLYITFPAAAARDRLVYEFGEWSRDEYALDVGDLSLWRLSGVDLDDVTLYTVKKGRKTKDNPTPTAERTPLLRFDGLAVRAAPISMLMGKDALAFVAEIYGGTLDGEFAQSEAGVEVSFDGGDIDLGTLPIATDQMKLNLVGIASGEADLTFDAADVKNSTGFLKLSFKGLGLGADSLVAGFQLPEVNFTEAGVAFEVKDGKMSVTEGTFESDVLDATLSGDIVLNKKLARSRNRLELLFSLPDDLDQLAQISPDLKRSRDDDGKYHLTIGGTVLAPSVRFARAGAAAAVDSAAGPRSPGPRPGMIGPAGEPGDRPGATGDPEERRKAREERIRERRERLKERREQAERGGQPGDDQEVFDEKGGPPDLEEFDPGMGDEGNAPEPLPPPFPDGPQNDMPPEGNGNFEGPMDDGPPPGEFEE